MEFSVVVVLVVFLLLIDGTLFCMGIDWRGELLAGVRKWVGSGVRGDLQEYEGNGV